MAADGRAPVRRAWPGFYERGKALSVATVGEIDYVIDPAGTREVVLRALTAAD
ncbi:hypothetical protein [Nocardia flavorosea]|uniref:Uncharacterized protein n=1 Tax=Nocardia flavorosea TaxID=53429 RepID=A0A846YAF5_9NOCA|nr:hypothetical protein [Nocardia flavorosea]NKY54792.1 hypothetical protein [Nocardia flavorosea]